MAVGHTFSTNSQNKEGQGRLSVVVKQYTRNRQIDLMMIPAKLFRFGEIKCVIASRNIEPYEEILGFYGETYWSQPQEWNM